MFCINCIDNYSYMCSMNQEGSKKIMFSLQKMDKNSHTKKRCVEKFISASTVYTLKFLFAKCLTFRKPNISFEFYTCAVWSCIIWNNNKKGRPYFLLSFERLLPLLTKPLTATQREDRLKEQQGGLCGRLYLLLFYGLVSTYFFLLHEEVSLTLSFLWQV